MSMTHTMNDDQYTYNPSAYVDQGQEVIPTPDYYEFKALSVGRRKNKDGEPVEYDGWPVLTINRVEIQGPQGPLDKFAVFQDIKTKPTTRRGSGGTKVAVSQAADLLRAIDVDLAAGVSDFEEVYKTLEEALADGQTFVAYMGLTARDMKWIQSQLDQLGPNADAKEKGEIWNKGTLKTKDFKNPDGSFRFQAQGPSGEILNARPTLTSFVPANRRSTVKLGTDEPVAA